MRIEWRIHTSHSQTHASHFLLELLSELKMRQVRMGFWQNYFVRFMNFLTMFVGLFNWL